MHHQGGTRREGKASEGILGARIHPKKNYEGENLLPASHDHSFTVVIVSSLA